MSTTELFAAAAVPAVQWRSGEEVEADVETAAHEDDADGHGDSDRSSRTDWSGGALRSVLVDPYGQHFRPHLFGM